MALSQFINNDLDVIPAKRLVYLQGHWPWGQPLHDRTTVDTQCTPTAINKHTRNRNLEISTAPAKAKLWEPAYSWALIQNKIDRQRVRFRESGRQTVRRLRWMVFGVEMRREVGRRGWIMIGFIEEQCFQFGVKELWRDSNRWGFGEFLGWVRYLLQCWWEFVKKRWDSYDYEAMSKF